MKVTIVLLSQCKSTMLLLISDHWSTINAQWSVSNTRGANGSVCHGNCIIDEVSTHFKQMRQDKQQMCIQQTMCRWHKRQNVVEIFATSNAVGNLHGNDMFWATPTICVLSRLLISSYHISYCGHCFIWFLLFDFMLLFAFLCSFINQHRVYSHVARFCCQHFALTYLHMYLSMYVCTYVCMDVCVFVCMS